MLKVKSFFKKEVGTPTSKKFWKFGQILDNAAMAYYGGYFKNESILKVKIL